MGSNPLLVPSSTTTATTTDQSVTSQHSINRVIEPSQQHPHHQEQSIISFPRSEDRIADLLRSHRSVLLRAPHSTDTTRGSSIDRHAFTILRNLARSEAMDDVAVVNMSSQDLNCDIRHVGTNENNNIDNQDADDDSDDDSDNHSDDDSDEDEEEENDVDGVAALTLLSRDSGHSMEDQHRSMRMTDTTDDFIDTIGDTDQHHNSTTSVSLHASAIYSSSTDPRCVSVTHHVDHDTELDTTDISAYNDNNYHSDTAVHAIDNVEEAAGDKRKLPTDLLLDAIEEEENKKHPKINE